ncbi:Crp/Fnr family transcriptional regulator [Fusibacillus kribbianus]|uniref:Crp/Fnr family transcriptional regulator n=1 Tax=Fusibacillus kribbianus TaxID=3044208 RepID=A0AAP4B8C5_9FIRM|nr:Crp/Fnr family transcriptional regulator [Ruminococcus sp. YH-rum2234]MDI9241520.1 Crp/Fnr family transcriptional regulator [Ruminococcus sp. YH-rum2234]
MEEKKNISCTVRETANMLRILQAAPIFSGLSQEQLTQLASHCNLVFKKRGCAIYRKEDVSNQFYLIKSGCIMESVFYGNSADIVVKIRSDGEYFGEMGLLSNEPCPNTALTLEDTVLVSIPQKYFLDAVWQNTSVCKVIILELIDRLLHSAQHMVNSLYLDAPGRLASTIVNLTVGSQQKTLGVRITQSALAFSCGMARQTAARVLSEWRSQGIIATERGRLQILDLDKLLDIILHSEIKN